MKWLFLSPFSEKKIQHYREKHDRTKRYILYANICFVSVCSLVLSKSTTIFLLKNTNSTFYQQRKIGKGENT